MTYRYIIAIAIVVIALGFFTQTPKCNAGWCPSYRCWSSTGCGAGCICLKQGGSFSGQCYSVD